MASDTEPDDVQDAVAELESAGFVLVDAETEELLIRSFPEHDGVFLSPNLIRGMWSSFLTVHSRRLRSAFLDELGDPLPEAVQVFPKGFPVEVLSEREDVAVSPSGNGFGKGFGNASTKEPPNPEAFNLKPASLEQAEPEGFAEFWEEWPNKIARKAAVKCWRARVKQGIPPSDLIAASRNYAAAVARKGTTKDFMLHPTTFLGSSERFADFVEVKPEPKMTYLVGGIQYR